MSQLKERMIRAARLDANLYEEVEADEGALSQAMTVVVLSSLAAGIGNLSDGGWSGVVIGTVGALGGWYIWAWLTYVIGTKILPEPETRSSPGELLRTIGFSSAPGVIRIVALIPFLQGITFFVSSVWMLVAMVIAVRQALDYSSTLRAIGVCIIGWIIQFFLLLLIFSVITIRFTGF
jgi:hypothetical protein